VSDLSGQSENHERREYDEGAHLRKYIREDPRSKVARGRLESRIGELVSESDAQPDAPEDMLEQVVIHYKTAVMQIALNAYLGVFREMQNQGQGNRAKAERHNPEPAYDVIARLEQYLREDSYWKESRDQLESRAVQFIPGSIQREAMLRYVTGPYASAVLEIALEACIRAFREGEEHARTEGAGAGAPRIAESIAQSVALGPRRRWPRPG
jgi:hypothetical protein